ncbi:ATP phosphoribosyltransferase regulatory subunit [Zooshikella ganghwensis]|uniref:ATP phosphoribosyltransferase regulatory subunit n=1 Tax=Zooshikella ganghwensis TaxID=202772 RepID=A0A4P9VL12_9GAMM|nr:ATP phosphoribosyltransferase regulatory subunit [Zooshikella ganghwensis]RDH42512.1 ATP phosphoribosyltransferase regulatory subunit [Zooshikella ganghwensis]
MTVADRWLLPDGIDEVLPPDAMRVEELRRLLLDLYHSWGYDLVIPPHIEYLDSLLTESNRDLELQMFKVTDQLTGRMMALRADTTPSVARIDAHKLGKEGPVRLCYCGSVFHTRPCSLAASRSPIQVGAELYGHAGIASDLEVINLMLATLALVGLDDVCVGIGHAGIWKGVLANSDLSKADQEELHLLMQRKALPELHDFIQQKVSDVTLASMLQMLPTLCGGIEVLQQAKSSLAPAGEQVLNALTQLEEIASGIQQVNPKVTLYFDLSEQRGFDYHTGVLFAAYTAGQGQAVAQGGRYDGVGACYGRSRPATGFSTDLKVLLSLLTANVTQGEKSIWAPVGVDRVVVDELRQRGERVICALPGAQTSPASLGCDRQLVHTDGQWQVLPL